MTARVRISRILFTAPKSGSDHSSEQSTRDPIRRTGTTRAASRIPYLILLQRGFAVRWRSHASPVVSYTTFSPWPGANAGRSVFCGTFRRRRSGSASPALTAGPLALRSPDFPPLHACRSDRSLPLRPPQNEIATGTIKTGIPEPGMPW